jgi:hypothetical protein
MNYYEFISDEYFVANISHNFQGLFFNHIPLLRKLKWREVVYGKFLLGKLSKENLEYSKFPSNTSVLTKRKKSVLEYFNVVLNESLSKKECPIKNKITKRNRLPAKNKGFIAAGSNPLESRKREVRRVIKHKEKNDRK